MSAHPSASTSPSTRESGPTSGPVPPPGWDVEHEQVVVCRDRATGLRAIIAIHSTALGPALGGTRFFPYASMDDALRDVLALSRGMSYKNALAGLDHGGGKAVIVGDPRTDKSEALLRAYGRFVQSLGGRYVTACDVGTYVADMDVVARETDFATGHSEVDGGAGDSSVLTAYGVFQGMRAAAAHLWGGPSLAGRRVGIAGVGKVGKRLARLLVEDGAEVVVSDVDAGAVATLQGTLPQVQAVAGTEDLVREDLDVYAPCALGGALDDRTVRRSRPPSCAARRTTSSPTPARGRPGGPRRPVLPRLPGQLRRGDPGRRRAARVLLRARPRQGVRHLRRDPRRARRGSRSWRHALRRGRRARRAADGRGGQDRAWLPRR